MNEAPNIKEILSQQAEMVDQSIEKYIPKKFKEDSLLFKINPPRYTLDLKALDRAICDPIWEFLERGGKRWRPALFLMICEALGGVPKKFMDFAIIPEVVHNGTLIADDIEDSSIVRRGKPCTYRIFGLDIAVNVSQCMYFLPMISLIQTRKITSEKARKLYEIHVEEMINLSLGQAMDIAWHKGLTPLYNVTEDQYLQMCAYKTGTLARMAARMAAVLAGADDEIVENLGRLAESIGIAFQIQDDILDVTGEEFAKGKGGMGMDVTEGKLTLIVIDSIRKASLAEREELVRILGMHTHDGILKNRAIEIMKKYGSLDYAMNFASKIVEESWNDVEIALPPSRAKEKLRKLAYFLIERKI